MADEERSIKAMRDEIKGLEAIRDRLKAERDGLKEKLDGVTHEWTKGEQTIRSLHWALGAALSEVRRTQREAKKFGAESCDWVALAE